MPSIRVLLASYAGINFILVSALIREQKLLLLALLRAWPIEFRGAVSVILLAVVISATESFFIQVFVSQISNELL